MKADIFQTLCNQIEDYGKDEFWISIADDLESIQYFCTILILNTIPYTKKIPSNILYITILRPLSNNQFFFYLHYFSVTIKHNLASDCSSIIMRHFCALARNSTYREKKLENYITRILVLVVIWNHFDWGKNG